MKIAKITYPDLNNGPGCRVSLWVSGCSIHCQNCFNSEMWDTNYGYTFNDDLSEALFSAISKQYINGLSILGGEPTDQGEELVKLLKTVKHTFPEKDIWMWTGRTMQELIDSGNTKLLEYVDVLIDGPFVDKLKDLSLAFRGSNNQNMWVKHNNIWSIMQ